MAAGPLTGAESGAFHHGESDARMRARLSAVFPAAILSGSPHTIALALRIAPQISSELMRWTSEFRYRAFLGLTAVCLAAGPGASELRAYEGENARMRFPSSGVQTGSTQTTYDREFIKEWESNPPRGLLTLSSGNIEPTKAAIKRYSEIVARGGWPSIPEVELQTGTSHPAVPALRRRLALTGDLQDSSESSSDFDYYVEKALRRFHAAHGLAPSGMLAKPTVAALTIPAAARLRQLKTNLARLQELVHTAGRKYVIVNIPAAQIEAVENDRVVTRHSAVVGKIDRPTPLLRSAIHEMNFNPIWHLPPTVIEKDLIPKGRELQRRGQSVLSKYGIAAYDGNGKKLDPLKIDWNSSTVHTLQYRQQPGKENPLGFVKVNFHNSYAVYMHATPSETLFSRNFRAASSGCVRVQGMDKLALWLLADNGGWRVEHIERLKTSGERYDARVRRPVPLYFVYITAWATPDGIVHFRRDLYQKDGLAVTASAY